MDAQKLDEIAKRYGYVLCYVTKSAQRIYRRTLGHDATVRLSVDEVQHLMDRAGEDGLRDYLERKFV